MNNELLQKYNHPIPRYTSYPPANLFTESFSSADYIDSLKESNGWHPTAISFYIHIPFCNKMCFYCGCNSCPIGKVDAVKEYVDAVIQEIRIVKQYIYKAREVTQVHFGGGTPNAIASEYLAQIVDELRSSFHFHHDAEIAIECNPAYLDEKYMKHLKELGFNRFSLGIQDFSKKVLLGVNRDASTIPVEELVAFLKDGNPKVKVNLDFIYGLPYQTPESFVETIQKAIDIKPDRLVTFSYAHVPWVNKAQEILVKHGLPTVQDKTEMHRRASELLLKSGYKAIGLDHFVQPDDELFTALNNGALHRNFQGYCTRQTTGQVYAFGVSGISQLNKVYAQNSKSVPEYVASITKGKLPIVKGYSLNNQEVVVREIITELMCNRRIVWSSLAKQFNCTIDEVKTTGNYNSAALEEFAKDGIITLNSEEIYVTDEGLLFLRNVAASFDMLLTSGQQQFSKPV